MKTILFSSNEKKSIKTQINLAMLTPGSKAWIGGVGMVIVPLLLMVACLAVDHSGGSHHPDASIHSFVISIAGGLVCVWVLPVRAFWRCLVSIAYIPASFYPLALFQFHAAAGFFGLRF
jgi:hypothetical protein